MSEARHQSHARLLDNHPYLSFVSTIGEGTFGFVQKVIDNRSSPPKEMAVKFIKRGPKTVTKYVEAEILNHCELNHPHVVAFKEVFLLREYLCILLELASKGNLWDYIIRQRRLKEGEARYLFQQLIFAVEYCHCKGVVNRDIKPGNICLSGHHGEFLKVCDFGFSKNELFQSMPNTYVGTPSFMAPEAIRAYSCRCYDGKTADVWSCGVTLYMMVTGDLPFGSREYHGKPTKDTNIAISRRILDGRYKHPRGISISLQDLLEKILVKDPKNRITIEGIKAHPWFMTALPSGANAMTMRYLQSDTALEQSVKEIRRLVQKAMREPRIFTDKPSCASHA